MAATIIIGAIVLLCIALAVRSLIKSRNKGGCDCGCGGCSPDKHCGK
ncbi:FeoB-associated Cys-rich membrane protein [Breznakiella homolactica]|uniref:FeoB-associated Cys-rich membrane protein n=1 Tax=Breznakiella homolactica TaxID=2798577 RepID=A0A7T8B8Q8_9SPIR|nr:FeoB-associated Cys-rich membrane protein [Breznakiella homolactica]